MRGLLASPLGLLIGLALGTLGSGGSILAVPALVYAAGETPRAATATSLLLVAAAAAVGLWTHARAGRVRFATGAAFGLVGTGGSLAGTALNQRIDADVLLLAFSGLILIAAWRMITGCPSCTRAGEARALAGTTAAAHRSWTGAGAALVFVIATIVGFLTGLFGVGGGFVVVPALTLVLGFAMPEAIGTSLLVVLINSIVALGARLDGADIHWPLATAFTATAVAGALMGGRFAGRLDPERTLRYFAAGLVVLAVYTAMSALANL